MKKIILDKSVYEKNALLKTAFSFIDQVYIHITQDADKWYIEWEDKEGYLLDYKEFENEAIRQQLIYNLNKETKEIRKILLGRAMASTMIEIDSDDKDYSYENEVEDERILKGWFDD